MKQRPIWLAAAVLAVVVLLAQVAGAATNTSVASVGSNASVSAQLAGTAPTVALPEQASSVAAEKAANGIANASQAVTDRGRGQAQNEVVAAAPAAAAPVDASGGARPGWGCGDKNHDHSAGPPGRPDATPPPGCTKP
jgi:ABC-type Na+ efflux pump permease subunit